MSLADDFNNDKKGPNKRKGTPYLDTFGEDLTQMASEGKLDTIIGRDKEVFRICQILSRKKKNNPIILGDPGVGKTAIVEAIAQRIVDKKVPRLLLNKKVVSLNMTTIVAGTKYRGEFEERMKIIVDELKKSPNVIVFIDEIHTLVGAGGVSGSLDASNILKPALARGQVQCIGATTLDEYRENIEDDGALTRRFQEVFVDPPSGEETIEILMKIKDSYEEHHNVLYDDKAIEACVKLSERYLKSRELPDKAIDLMDETGARKNLADVKVPIAIKKLEAKLLECTDAKVEAVKKQDYEKAAYCRDQEIDIRKEIDSENEKWEKSLKKKKKQVLEEDVAETISMQTGIPLKRLAGDELDMILKMEEELKSNIIGQDRAIEVLSKVIRRTRAGVASHKRPTGSFMFLGPTGVGKTQTVKALSEYLFGDEDSFIRIDMSEYQEKFNVSRLVGSPPGYVGHEDGGQLTELVRRKPYSVVLFDEIEKAHPDVFNILLQVLDEGRLTDSLGRTVDFTNSIIVLTSNVGARRIADFGTGIGFESQAESTLHDSKIESIIKKELKNKFSPEFLNRLDEIVLFDQLSEESILKIVDVELVELVERMKDINIDLEVDDEAKKFLAKEGYEPAYGARPLKRAIQQHVEDTIADAIITKQVKEGKVVISKHKKENKLFIK
jgi:ATP-dependent Clp protease ATP-binding subunit ClpC